VYEESVKDPVNLDEVYEKACTKQELHIMLRNDSKNIEIISIYTEYQRWV